MRRPPLPPLPFLLLLPLLLLLREGAARVFTVGYITGSKRRPGDLEYTRPGLTISGAATLALAEVNGEPTPPPGHPVNRDHYYRNNAKNRNNATQRPVVHRERGLHGRSVPTIPAFSTPISSDPSSERGPPPRPDDARSPSVRSPPSPETPRNINHSRLREDKDPKFVRVSSLTKSPADDDLDLRNQPKLEDTSERTAKPKTVTTSSAEENGGSLVHLQEGSSLVESSSDNRSDSVNKIGARRSRSSGRLGNREGKNFLDESEWLSSANPDGKETGIEEPSEYEEKGRGEVADERASLENGREGTAMSAEMWSSAEDPEVGSGSRFAKEIDYGSVVGVTAGGGMETAAGEVVSAGRVFGGDPGRVLRALGHRIELRVAETYGEEAESIRAAARLWRDGVDAYLGPQETCLHEGRMAAAFNLPMVSYFCTHRETSDKRRYPTFARTRPPDSQISKSVTALLLYYNWTQVAFLHQTSADAEFSAVASTLLSSFHSSGIMVRAEKTWPGPFHLGYMTNPFHGILEETKENARIYVVLGHYYEHVALLVAMDEMKMLEEGEYFVVGVDTEPYDASSPAKYFGGPLHDGPHPRAIEAFRSYLGVLPSPSVLLSSSPPRPLSLYPTYSPPPLSPPIQSSGSEGRHRTTVRANEDAPSKAWNGEEEVARDSNDDLAYTVIPSSVQEAADRFSALVNTYMELPPFSFKNPLVSLGVAVRIPPEAAYLYDAVHVYTRALEIVLLSGGDPRNGTAIAVAMRGTRYLSAMGYVVSLDENGDAEGNYTVVGRRQVSSVSGGYAMVPVGKLYPAPEAVELPVDYEAKGGKTSLLPELRMLVDVDWVGSDPPLAEPPCGFAGEKCIIYTGEIVGSVAGGVVLALAIISLVLYRNWRYEQALDSLLWKVEFKDIQMSEAGEPTSGANGGANGNPGNPGNTNRITRPLIRTSQASLSSNPDAEWRRGVAYTPVGIYRGRPFAVKKLQSPRQRPMAVDRAMKKELKLMRDLRHDNLIAFIGACTDPPNVCILTEYCARGSLRDILENEDLKLDNMFVASLIGDIIRGMIFLHDSPIRSHGSLRPSNCLVDSRWVLKIADFGFHRFKREADVPPFRHINAYFSAFTNGPLTSKGHSLSGESGSKTSSSRRKRGDSSSNTQPSENLAMEALAEARLYTETVLYKSPELLRMTLCSASLPHVTTGPDCKEEGSILPTGLALSKDLPTDPVQLAAVLAAAWTSRPDLWQGSQKGDVYSFALVAYELHARQGPFGMNALPSLTHAEILKKVIAGPKGGTGSFRPSLDLLETSFDFVRECLKECWTENPDDRPDFRTVRMRLRPMRKGMKPNIFDNMMAMMEKYANNLEQLVDERTDQLIVEKRKTDALLYEMLPRCVAEQLKRGHRVEAESYDCVTIYFSDIVGFTAMSAESTPLQVVDFLNDLYTCFDSILENYDVYKVETIGDAYMVVSGLPIRNGIQHAGEIASMSLHLLDAVKHFEIRHRRRDPLMLRIGIHSGPVCAGVVGLKMPRYCLFGDTVNTASRMESNGIPLKIHCSSECRELLDQLGGYRLASRGLVSMKGKGEVQTHWLLGEEGDEEESGEEAEKRGTRVRGKKRESRRREEKRREEGREEKEGGRGGGDEEERENRDPAAAAAATEIPDSSENVTSYSLREDEREESEKNSVSGWERFEEFGLPDFKNDERSRRGCSEGREDTRTVPILDRETRNSDDSFLSRRSPILPSYERALSTPLSNAKPAHPAQNSPLGRLQTFANHESGSPKGHLLSNVAPSRDNPSSLPIRSSMRKSPGDWSAEDRMPSRGVPGRSSLRKQMGMAAFSIGMNPAFPVHRRRRSLESSPKRLRFASEVTGEDSGGETTFPNNKGERGVSCARVQEESRLNIPQMDGDGKLRIPGWEPAGMKPSEGASSTARDRGGKTKKTKKSKGRDGDRKVASSEWCNFILSNTVPPWRRRGKSAEYLEREDSYKWEDVYGCRRKSRSPTSYLSKNMGQLDPYGYFTDASRYLSSDPGIPKVRSLVLVSDTSMGVPNESSGGETCPLVMHVNKSEDGLINERSVRIGDYASLRANCGRAGSPMDTSRLSVPQTDPGFYSSTSCESNQSYESCYGGRGLEGHGFVTPSIAVSLSRDSPEKETVKNSNSGPYLDNFGSVECVASGEGGSPVTPTRRFGRQEMSGTREETVFGVDDSDLWKKMDTVPRPTGVNEPFETLIPSETKISDVPIVCGENETVNLLLEDCEHDEKSELLARRGRGRGGEETKGQLLRDMEEGIIAKESECEEGGSSNRRSVQVDVVSEDDDDTTRPLLLPLSESGETGN